MNENFGTITPLFGGALIGLAASLLLLWNGRIAGISGIVAGLLRPAAGEVAWRVAFLAGLFAGGVLLSVVDPRALDVRPPAPLGMTVLAGLLVGYGTRLGNGCTSGHGVCGVSRLSPRSLVATATFMLTGALTVYFVHSGLGGAR
ncbi:MAG TPA: YeeE/YedE family protein [Candidatus Limnocylindria bacterium]|nr:YeeE/YedE family protein [Candidatus Limnocylindria bacterium]